MMHLVVWGTDSQVMWQLTQCLYLTVCVWRVCGVCVWVGVLHFAPLLCCPVGDEVLCVSSCASGCGGQESI